MKPVASGVLIAASVFPPTAPIAAPVALGVAATGAGLAGLGHITEDEDLKKFGKGVIEAGVGGYQNGESARDVLVHGR